MQLKHVTRLVRQRRQVHVYPAGETAPAGTCVPGSDPVEMVAPGTRIPGCLTIDQSRKDCLGS